MVAGHSYREISTSHRLQRLKQLLRRVRLSVGVGVRQLSPSDLHGTELGGRPSASLEPCRLGRLRQKGKPHCRFGAGLRGGAGLSAAAGWGSNFRVSLMAACLTSKSDRRPSSISAPDFLLKLSASSRIDFTLPSKSSALPSARPGTMLSIFVIALWIPAKPLSALRMMLSMSSPLLAREAV